MFAAVRKHGLDWGLCAREVATRGPRQCMVFYNKLSCKLGTAGMLSLLKMPEPPLKPSRQSMSMSHRNRAKPKERVKKPSAPKLLRAPVEPPPAEQFVPETAIHRAFLQPAQGPGDAGAFGDFTDARAAATSAQDVSAPRKPANVCVLHIRSRSSRLPLHPSYYLFSTACVSSSASATTTSAYASFSRLISSMWRFGAERSFVPPSQLPIRCMVCENVPATLPYF